MRKQKEMNNKGFSLVELIVVIAIMVVLVAVLAPVFTKYVEQSRRATDVQNANAIAEAVLIDVAENSPKAVFVATPTELTADNLPEAIASLPEVKGQLIDGATFWVSYDEGTNKATVIIQKGEEKTGDLTDEDYAQAYKDAKEVSDATTVPAEEGGEATE